MKKKVDRSLLVIFGLPGAGKTYAADVLGKKFGYFIYDGDTDIPEYMRDALLNKAIITDAMRREFLTRMIASITKLTQTHHKLAVHQTLIKEFMRKEFLDAFPHAQFLLVETDDVIREQRYMKRDYFNLGLPYLRHMSNLFEQPEIPHIIIENGTDGEKAILAQLKNVLLIIPTPG
ncbi:MAG: AAA family ATPase [Patescibacteria group bacterium]